MQGVWVAARATRLPEAEGPRAGVAGAGPDLRLLILGDSSAAGVGVARQEAALAGQVVADLARSHRVSWRLVAKSGATARSAQALLQSTPAGTFSHALVALGVNDTKNFVPLPRFEAAYAATLDQLSTRFGVRHVVLSGVPPMGLLPILPRPLRDVLGARAARFDTVIRALAAARGGQHLPMDFTEDISQMAEDGLHPGPDIYAAWAARAAALLRETA
ncbi:SGNH/GDSL hydrolase family protein [Gymnodinialimonas mytili]|uniref:SGNH/GDSL hydrolase family protein n=1 Tax=Gymnodinialimonas mytili TaxID=3126503 RepID=UPI0030EF67E1